VTFCAASARHRSLIDAATTDVSAMSTRQLSVMPKRAATPSYSRFLRARGILAKIYVDVYGGVFALAGSATEIF
jgi:hypothetical protein